jgi:predicted RNase H-like HicB family nuclease
MSQGKTVEAALRNVRSAIRAYLKASHGSEIKRIPEVLTSQVEESKVEG